VQFRLLGAVEAYSRGQRLDLGPRRQRFVLAVLALEAGQEVPIDRLVRLAWPASAPPTARHAVHVCVSRLRRVLAGAGAPEQGVDLLTRGSGYLLRVEPGQVDAHLFRQLVRQARETTCDAEKIVLLDRALGLWRGPALSGAAPDEIRGQLCHALDEARLAAAEQRVEAGLRLGRHTELVAELVELTELFPLRERLVWQLMVALYRSGRRSDALLVYRRTRSLLANELGLDPGADLQQLELAILRADPIPGPAGLVAGDSRHRSAG
jgi:DNA-binding SARP family transcriptional activator